MINNPKDSGSHPQYGDTIRLLRAKKGLTREELAQALEVSPEAIDHYENNTWRPGTPTLVRLSEALGVTIPELTGGCSLLYDECGHMLIVRHVGGNQIKVVGTVREEDLHRSAAREGKENG